MKTTTPQNLAELQAAADDARSNYSIEIKAEDHALIVNYREAQRMAAEAVAAIRGALNHTNSSTFVQVRDMNDVHLVKAPAVVRALEADSVFMATLERAGELQADIDAAEAAVRQLQDDTRAAEAALAEARRVALEKATAEIDGKPEVVEAEKTALKFRRLGQLVTV